MTLLEVNNLHLRLKSDDQWKPILKGISFSLQKGGNHWNCRKIGLRKIGHSPFCDETNSRKDFKMGSGINPFL